MTLTCSIFSSVHLRFILFQKFKEIDYATNKFEEVRECDPYRLENMDIYSNLLYVKVREMCKLCHFVTSYIT